MLTKTQEQFYDSVFYQIYPRSFMDSNGDGIGAPAEFEINQNEKINSISGIASCECDVVEDSDAGIEAAKPGGMYAIAVGAAEHNPKADVAVKAIDSLMKAISLLGV